MLKIFIIIITKLKRLLYICHITKTKTMDQRDYKAMNEQKTTKTKPMETVSIPWGLETLEVSGTFDKGRRSTYDCPADDPRFEIEEIIWDQHDIDVKPILTDSDIEKIEQIVIDKLT